MRILAALALLMHLSWPFTGQLRAAPAEAVQVICTVHGAMSIPLDEAPRDGEANPSCALCGAAGVAISQGGTPVPDTGTAATANPQAYAAPACPAYRLSADPRAPPPAA